MSSDIRISLVEGVMQQKQTLKITRKWLFLQSAASNNNNNIIFISIKGLKYYIH